MLRFRILTRVVNTRCRGDCRCNQMAYRGDREGGRARDRAGAATICLTVRQAYEHSGEHKSKRRPRRHGKRSLRNRGAKKRRTNRAFMESGRARIGRMLGPGSLLSTRGRLSNVVRMMGFSWREAVNTQERRFRMIACSCDPGPRH